MKSTREDSVTLSGASHGRGSSPKGGKWVGLRTCLVVRVWWNPYGISGLFRIRPHPAGRIRGRWRKGRQAWRPSVSPVRPSPPGPSGNGRGSCVPDAAAGTGRRSQQKGAPLFCVSARAGTIMVWTAAPRSFRLHGQSGAATIPRRRASGRHIKANRVEWNPHMIFRGSFCFF